MSYTSAQSIVKRLSCVAAQRLANTTLRLSQLLSKSKVRYQ